MKIEDIAKKLKKQWEPYHGGNCNIFSVGYDCECHLCLIDELLEIAIKASQHDVESCIENPIGKRHSGCILCNCTDWKPEHNI